MDLADTSVVKEIRSLVDLDWEGRVQDQAHQNFSSEGLIIVPQHKSVAPNGYPEFRSVTLNEESYLVYSSSSSPGSGV